jgi:CheY-like chemotaxis protein
MGSRILLADDSITIQKVVNLTFADEGIEVVAVSNGEIAERRLNEVSPDLVLADIFMPGKNGYELCEAIKSNSKFRNVPVVLLVGAFEPFDQAEARRVQADAHLTKPFESRILVETVRKLIGKSDRPAAPLTSMSPVDSEPANPIQEPHTMLAPEPVSAPFSVDFESASGEWRPIDASMHDENVPRTADETLPSDLPRVSAGESPSFLSVDIEPPSEVHRDEVAHAVSFWERTTSELVSPQSSGAVDSVESHAPANLFDSSSHAGATTSEPQAQPSGLAPESEEWPSTAPSAFGFEMPQMIVDFEESLPSRPREDDDPSMVDVTPPSADVYVDQPSAYSESHIEDSQAPGGWQAAAGSNGLNTTTLELPDSVRSSMGVGEKSDDRFSFPEASTDTDAALGLLAAEEPLGDVLSGSAIDIMPGAPTGASLSAFERAPLSEFDLELTPEEASYGEPASPAASAETRITGELITADLPMDGQALVESATEDFVASELAEAPAEAPAGRVEDELQGMASPESSSAEALASGPFDHDWTSPGAVVHSTGRLDSMVIPFGFEEPHSHEVARETDDHMFSPSSTDVDEPAQWGSAARFFPIDVEASPVEEKPNLTQHFDSSLGERGFEIAHVVTDETAPSVSANAQSRDSLLSPVELSPQVIDEIVKRVVSQISDSVVREIAWEIVPDCVERIIDQQTREALSRR